LKAIPHDIDVVISLKNGKWKFSDVSSEAPSSISQAEAVTEFRKLIDGSSVAARPAADPTKPAPAPRPAPRTEAPATKPAGKALTPAEVKAEFQRQIDAAPRFGDGGPETITLKAGGSTVTLQNTARRVAKYMKALGTVKGGKTPKPVPAKTDTRPSGVVSWGGELSRRTPLKTITDMIDDLDPQAAVDFAAAQGIDLEEALKGDRKRLDRVRGLKPTPEPQEVANEPPTAGSNFLEEMYGEQAKASKAKVRGGPAVSAAVSAARGLWSSAAQNKQTAAFSRALRAAGVPDKKIVAAISEAKTAHANRTRGSGSITFLSGNDLREGLLRAGIDL